MIFIDLRWQTLSTNYITVRCPKSMTIFYKRFLVFILIKPDSLTTKIIFYKVFYKLWEKVFLLAGLRSGQKLNSVGKPCTMSPSANNIGLVAYRIMNRFVLT